MVSLEGPGGDYAVRTWHPYQRAEVQALSLTVAGEESTSVRFNLLLREAPAAKPRPA